MIKDILHNIESRMVSSIHHSNEELNKVRSGRANPDMFNSLIIDYYGSKTPLNQVCTVSVPESRLITLSPFEKSLLPIIEKAISDANMGFTPGNNGTSVLVPIPPLSEERRKELIKIVHNLIEEGRIAIRNIRRDGIQQLNNFGKDDSISEDVIKDNEGEIQKITDNSIDKLNNLLEDKEKELLVV
jgi:ribosome recycling factor